MINDDPGDLNILISHVERCGVSWFVRLISLVYEKMFGQLKKWNIRTSRLMASHPKYPMQKGWNTVRYTPIDDIIKKPFDKIILLQRKIEALRESIFIYRFTDKDYETEKDKPEYEEWFNKLQTYYEQTYAPVNEPNVLRVYLEDLNNYTTSTLNEVLDFLNFPKEGRPMIIPVNPPERTWQAFSATLNRGQRITKRLIGIYNKYNNTELEFIAQNNNSMVTSSNIIGHDNKLLPIEQKIQNKWQISMNPNVRVPDALEVLRVGIKKRKKDMKQLKIVIIGPKGKGLGCHFGENIIKEFKKMGIDTVFLTMPLLIKDLKIDLQKYHIRSEPKKYLSLSYILNSYNLSPDFVFVDGTRFLIDNNTDYFVFYNHRGWHLPFSVKGLDVAFLKNEHYKEIREVCNIPGIMIDLPPSVSLDVFQTNKKEIIEPVGIGYRRSFNSWRNVVKYYEGYESIINLNEAETLVFKKVGYRYFNTPVDDLQYREILKRIKCLWFPIPYDQHISRRMLEAMACKTLCVFRLDNEKHEKYLKKLGFINYIHYIGLKSVEDIKNIKDIIEDNNIDEIIENAYNIVKEQHTHRIRAEQILNIYKNMTNV